MVIQVFRCLLSPIVNYWLVCKKGDAMKDAIDFLISYPLWVKVVISILLFTCLLLLVIFKPNLPKESTAAPIPGSTANVGGNNVGNVAGRDIIINAGPTAAQTLTANRIITLKQKSKIVNILSKNRGSISIFYVLGDQKAEEYAKEIRDIFDTAAWHTNIRGAIFGGFDSGLMLSAKETLPEIEVIITAFDAGDIVIKPWINPNMQENSLELQVGNP